MPKGEIVGMFTRRVCLMERTKTMMEITTTTMENMKAMMITLEEVIFYEDRAQEDKRRRELSIDFAGEGSEDETFEYLEIILS
jgi:hypothetical protein